VRREASWSLEASAPRRVLYSAVPSRPRQLALPLFPAETGSDRAPTSADVFSERHLAAVAVALGARSVTGWSDAEGKLAGGLPTPPEPLVERVRRKIQMGRDPLGDLFCDLRPAAERRESGATYTPAPIVDAMLRWAKRHADPARIVDPGAGSGRFLLQAGRRFRKARLIGIELDPLAALTARANLAAAGMTERTEIVLADYRAFRLPPESGQTLFIGNPPYVRHHLLEPHWKKWLTEEATRRGLTPSQLAGLHVYFFLATALNGRAGDVGAFITAAEWLDVNYGRMVRELFLGDLGGKELVVIEPTAMPFLDAATTAAITFFEIAARPKSVALHRVKTLEGLKHLRGGRRVRRERLEAETRWSHLTRVSRAVPAGFVELGELCRVHRGQVTGANKVWVTEAGSTDLPPRVLFPAVTKARELFSAGHVLADAAGLRKVIDLPVDLDCFNGPERRVVDRFLRRAKEMGADSGYVAQNRKAWWAVGLRAPAPILATYMARRSPAFVRNEAEARHINIAHGIYPRDPLSDDQLVGLADFLSATANVRDGRTYAGGLTKFEPREMERIFVPGPEALPQYVNA
jgi:adenine-specific DNA-methyltransferase